MTTSYVDPNTVHVPATGGSIPAAWGTNVRNNIVTLANPPGAIVQRITTQSLTNGGFTVVSFTGTDVRDTDAYHNPSSNPDRVTCPVGLGGLYLCTATVGFAANATGVRGAYFIVNGSGATGGGAGQVQGTGAFDTIVNISDEIYIAAGDYLGITLFQNSGGALNMQSARMSMRLVSVT